MGGFGYALYYLREYFFPFGCAVCGAPLFSGREAWYGLCGCCEGEMRAGAVMEDSRCDLCGRPLISEIGRCLPCRQNAETEQPACDRIVSIFPYSGLYLNLLSAFKYGRSLGAGHFLAEVVTRALGFLPEINGENCTLVPVPPRPGKIRKTGWDQIAALSGLIKRIPGAPAIDACLVRMAAQTQKKLDRISRKTNLKGRITAKRKAQKVCVLFDDVITTGSTMNACAAALKAAGAEKVYGVCLFYD
jgi:ComF family protein